MILLCDSLIEQCSPGGADMMAAQAQSLIDWLLFLLCKKKGASHA